MTVRFTAGLARRVRRALAAGETLAALSRRRGMPARQTFYKWMARDPAFAADVRAAEARRDAAVRERVCDLIAEGWSLARLSGRPDMPHETTVLLWLQAEPGFRADYQIACEIRAERLADEVMRIADAWEPEPGQTPRQVNEKARIRIAARTWMYARLKLRRWAPAPVPIGQ